jgi:hypothetical protein
MSVAAQHRRSASEDQQALRWDKQPYVSVFWLAAQIERL